MNDLERLEKRYVEMVNEIERLKNSKGFDFREWFKEQPLGYRDVFHNQTIFDLNTEHYETPDEQTQQYYSNRNITEECIKKHFEQIVGDSDVSFTSSERCFLSYGHRTKTIHATNNGAYQCLPKWLYFAPHETGDIEAEVARMKTLYGKCIVTQYLTDTYT